ncbi:acyl-CoA dehydrogenase [Sphingobium sp. EM0848]|uniref:acyl-CoA dehydrogenase n=1 Tax=Sphingobium sp. EM0848 TaxID=2743473 RepID=UPI00159CA4F3|nr:acyl-CoA dehydrogenase [Sphingobium sp. EM0848]
MSDPQSYVGRQEVLRDWSDSDRFTRLSAMLDHETPPWQSSVLPPLGHWLCFLPSERQSAMGHDGHPKRNDDGLLPNVDLPRRMWAGSRVQFLGDIPLDSPIIRTSTLTAATPKSGRSGNMLFVTVRHEVAVEGREAAIVEEQDIVYREAAPVGAPFARAAVDPGEEDPVIRTLTPDPVLLFRYSALTFNAHRIHYDRDYTRDEEGYPGLVVQGPLLATLMLDHFLREEKARIGSFSFRAASPSFDGEPIRLGFRREGNEAALRVVGPAGVAMTGSVEIAA